VVFAVDKERDADSRQPRESQDRPAPLLPAGFFTDFPEDVAIFVPAYVCEFIVLYKIETLFYEKTSKQQR